MRTGTVDLHQATRTQLLGLARDALRIAARPSPTVGEAAPGPELSTMVGLLTENLDALDQALREVAREVAHEAGAGRVRSVEGVFEGDPQAASEAVELWLGRGREALDGVRPAVVNAHIAAAGLAASR